MKNIFIVITLAIILISSLTVMSCSTTSPTTTSPPTTTPASTTPPVSSPTNSSPSTTTKPTTSTPSSTTTAAGGVIKIGHIRPLTGQQAMVSPRMIQAFDFAFQQINYQIAGKQVQIITGDTKGESQTAIDVARKMVENDKVALLVGPTQAGEELAVAGYANQAGIPEIFTNPAPVNIFNQANKWAIGASGTDTSLPSTMGAYIYDQLKYKRIDVLTRDDASGHAFLNAVMEPFKKRGGQVVQEQYTPYPNPDFAPFLTTLKDADAVVAWTSANDAIKLLTQYHEMSIDKKYPLVGAFVGGFLQPFILMALPPGTADAYVGVPVPTSYSPLIDTPANKQWIAAYQAKFGKPPEDDTESGPYEGALAIIEALKATGGDTNPDKLKQALLTVNVDGPEGRLKFDAKTQAAIKTFYIAKVAKQGTGFVLQPVFTYNDVPPGGL